MDATGFGAVVKLFKDAGERDGTNTSARVPLFLLRLLMATSLTLLETTTLEDTDTAMKLVAPTATPAWTAVDAPMKAPRIPEEEANVPADAAPVVLILRKVSLLFHFPQHFVSRWVALTCGNSSSCY